MFVVFFVSYSCTHTCFLAVWWCGLFVLLLVLGFLGGVVWGGLSCLCVFSGGGRRARLLPGCGGRACVWYIGVGVVCGGVCGGCRCVCLCRSDAGDGVLCVDVGGRGMVRKKKGDVGGGGGVGGSKASRISAADASYDWHTINAGVATDMR